MPAHTPMMLHRSIVRDAIRIAWNRKALWVFAVFAALVSTGGIMDVAFRTFRQVETGRDVYFQALDGALPGLTWLQTYIRLMSVIEPRQAAVTMTIISLCVIALVGWVIWSQAALIAGVLPKQGTPRPMSLLRAGLPWIPNLTAIALVGKILQAVLVALSTLPLVLYLTDATTKNGIIYVGTFLVFFPLTILIHLTSILTAFETMRHEIGIIDAAISACQMVKKHWLAALELGILLFVFMTTVGMITLGAFLICAIPFSIIISAAIAAGTPIIAAMAVVTAVLVSTMLIWLAGGFTVSMQYAAWSLFHEHASHKHATKRIVPKLERLFAKL